MAVYEQRFYLESGSLVRRAWRDLRLALALARLTWRWLIVGGRIRRTYARAKHEGRPFWVD